MSEHWASHSQLVTYRNCPQQWNYHHIRRLEKVDPDDIKVEMNFGSWWHALLAADSIERGREKNSLQLVPKTLRGPDDAPEIPTDTAQPIKDVLQAATDWWSIQSSEAHQQWLDRIGENLPDRLDTVYSRWQAQWAEEIATEAPLAVEMGWRRELPPMPQPDGTSKDLSVVLIGYVDEVYLDLRRNMVVVRDHKTAKVLASQSTVDDMMDSQLQFYAWGASPMVTAWGKGSIQATAYDRVGMIRAKTPQVLQAGGLGKTVTDFDRETYEEWAKGPDGLGVPFPGRKKDGSAAGIYQMEPAVVERLSTPAARSIWYQRTLTPLNGNLIKAHLRAAVDSAVDIGLTRKRIELTSEAARNLTATCKWCDFVGLCRAEMVGGVGGEYDLDAYKLRVRK